MADNPSRKYMVKKSHNQRIQGNQSKKELAEKTEEEKGLALLDKGDLFQEEEVIMLNASGVSPERISVNLNIPVKKVRSYISSAVRRSAKEYTGNASQANYIKYATYQLGLVRDLEYKTERFVHDTAVVGSFKTRSDIYDKVFKTGIQMGVIQDKEAPNDLVRTRTELMKELVEEREALDTLITEMSVTVKKKTTRTSKAKAKREHVPNSVIDVDVAHNGTKVSHEKENETEVSHKSVSFNNDILLSCDKMSKITESSDKMSNGCDKMSKINDSCDKMSNNSVSRDTETTVRHINDSNEMKDNIEEKTATILEKTTLLDELTSLSLEKPIKTES